MKSVLISIQPKWVEKICKKIGEENGKPIYKKRIEVRKGRPNEPIPIKCLIYCTYGQLLYADYPNGADSKVIELGEYKVSGKDKIRNMLNGKVIGEFVCDRIDKYILTLCDGDNYHRIEDYYSPLRECCLTQDEIVDYGKGKDIYGWHISDLKIYDKPKELSEFYSAKWDMPCEHKKRGFNMDFCMAYENGSHFCKELICDKKRLTRPPQSWCYVESLGE